MGAKTMGSFIAALRKARGMTQQDVADRLNVSNKTVSKWERGEGYPEITVVPALAELFEVTCDEILRGERQLTPAKETGTLKTEKQIRRIAQSSLLAFKNLSYVAGALSAMGFVLLLTVSYAFYRPIVGFGIASVFTIGSITVQLFSINTLKSRTRTDDLPGDLSDTLAPLQRTVDRYSFGVFILNAAFFILGLPFILLRDSYYVQSVISFETYVSSLPLLLTVITLLGLIFFNLFRKKLGFHSGECAPVQGLHRMNVLQSVSLLLAMVLAFLDSFLLTAPGILLIGPFFLLFGYALVVPVREIMKAEKGFNRTILFLAATRNLLLAIAFVGTTSWMTVCYGPDGEVTRVVHPSAGPFIVLLGALTIHVYGRYFSKGSRNGSP